MKKSKITFEVQLDENRVPEEIKWSAPDGGINNEASKAVFLSVWNHNSQETLNNQFPKKSKKHKKQKNQE